MLLVHIETKPKVYCVCVSEPVPSTSKLQNLGSKTVYMHNSKYYYLTSVLQSVITMHIHKLATLFPCYNKYLSPIDQYMSHITICTQHHSLMDINPKTIYHGDKYRGADI